MAHLAKALATKSNDMSSVPDCHIQVVTCRHTPHPHPKDVSKQRNEPKRKKKVLEVQFKVSFPQSTSITASNISDPEKLRNQEEFSWARKLQSPKKALGQGLKRFLASFHTCAPPLSYLAHFIVSLLIDWLSLVVQCFS